MTWKKQTAKYSTFTKKSLKKDSMELEKTVNCLRRMLNSGAQHFTKKNPVLEPLVQKQSILSNQPK